MLVCIIIIVFYVSLVPTQTLLRRSTTRTFVQSFGELWEVFERKKLFNRSQCFRYFDVVVLAQTILRECGITPGKIIIIIPSGKTRTDKNA